MNRLKLSQKDIDIIEALKEDLQGEYDAINLYEKHISEISIPEIKNMLIHIKEEEEEHVQELKSLLSKYTNL